jgi:transposase
LIRLRCAPWAAGKKTGPNPTDRRRLGSKHHLITDARGLILAVILTGANAHDVTQLLPLVEALPAIPGKPGRPRQRPDGVQGDRGYDSEPHRNALRKMGITPLIAKRRTPHGSGLGTTRYVVERSVAHLHQHRRLRIRYDRNPIIHEAFLKIACILDAWNTLKCSFC